MVSVFISYSHEDRPYADAMAKKIEDEGGTPWYDKSLLPGERFANVIKERISQSQFVFVIWSKSASCSAWVQREAKWAVDANNIVVVRIDDTELSGDIFDRHAISFAQFFEKCGEIIEKYSIRDENQQCTIPITPGTVFK